MEIKTHLALCVADALLAAKIDYAESAAPILIERPKIAAHGDFSCNIAMQLARALKQNPRALAEQIIQHISPSKYIKSVDIAGAGFINFHLTSAAKLAIIAQVLEAKENFGRITQEKPEKIQVEFVSANPTGPLHVGHGRGAAYGASLANLLEASGASVSREYYVNDAGRQMDILALSAWLRYLDLYNERVAFPQNAYQGTYIHDMALNIKIAKGALFLRKAAEVLNNVPPFPHIDRTDKEAEAERENHLDALIANAKKLLRDDWQYIHQHVLTEQLADCRSDLEAFGVHYATWFSENSLFDTGLVDKAMSALDKAGHLYEQNGAKWFKSSSFGDEKDRVVQRENGLYTYFASDIAYHLNKFERGFDKVINVWGADHHGYIPRIKGALQALNVDPARLEVALVQFAVLYKEGKKVPMSTRSGKFVPLRWLREEAGNDACRFFYIMRKSDQHLDFDIDLATSKSNDNPVYYIQYAHARISSILADFIGEADGLAAELEALQELNAADFAKLTNPHELTLAAKLEEYPELISSAARDYAPHQIAFYLKDLAAEFHSYYNDKTAKILIDDADLKLARLALICAVRQVLRNGLFVLGVSHPNTM